MPESTGTALSQMNQETALAQEALRDERPQGRPDAEVDRRHEERDANLKAIALTATGMGVLGIGIFLGLWLLLGLFTRTPAPPDAPISPLALNPPTPPAPRIEDATPQNYRLFLRAEEEMLHSSGPLAPGERAVGPTSGSSPSAAPSLTNPGPGVVGPGGNESPAGTVHISVEQAEDALLQRGFATRPQAEPSPSDAIDSPNSLPRVIQPPDTYRAQPGPEGQNP